MILVTGGAGFIGSNFVLDWCAGHDEPVVNLDKLTYAGNLENLAPLAGDPRHVFVHGDIGDRTLVARLLAAAPAAARSSTSPPRPTSTARSTARPPSSQTNVVGTFTLLEAARAYWSALPEPERDRVPLPARLDRRGLRHRSAPTTGVHRDDALRPELPVLGLEGRVRPPRARLPPHLRPAHARRPTARTTTALPVPREADPADDPQRARGQAAAGLRRRPERARLALRRRPLRGAARRPRDGPRPARPTTSAATPRQANLEVVARDLRAARRAAPRGGAAAPRADHLRHTTAPATTAATRSTRRRSAASSAGRRARPSRPACAGPSRGTSTNGDWVAAR